MPPASNTAYMSSDFETLFNAALAKYTKQTGKDLRNHPLADRIDGCDNPDSILDIFQEQSKAFEEFRNGDTKLLKWLRPVVNVLHALSTNAVLTDRASLVSAGCPAAFSSFIPCT
jgi:fungal STAND N-terminal Goodbye domain